MTKAALATTEATTEEPAPSRATVVARLTALVLGTAAFTALIDVVGGWSWILVVYVIIAIVILHELGHYLTAKWSGMKATEFFIGFGPKLWSIKRGETEYGIKAFPLGGYVRILGMTSLEELEAADEPRSFINQSTTKRVVVASAGSVMHVLLAFVLAFAALFFIGRPDNRWNLAVQALVVVKGATTPAQAAGLRTGDVVEAVDGTKVTSSVTVASNGQVTPHTNLDALIQRSGGRPLVLEILRGTSTSDVVVHPRILDAKSKRYEIGIYLEFLQQAQHPGVLSSITGAGSFLGEVTEKTADAFGGAFSIHGLWQLYHDVADSKAGQQAASNPNQPHSLIGAGDLLADAFQAGPLEALEVLISLNISLAVLNMIPMLPLDGGHVAIALYERIRTRRGHAPYRADVNKLTPYAYAFLALLVVFVLSKAYLDLAHGVANPFG